MKLIKKFMTEFKNSHKAINLAEFVDNFIDECYGEVQICNLPYMQSEVLKQVDPIAYREISLGILDNAIQNDTIFSLDDTNYYYVEHAKEFLLRKEGSGK